MIVILCQTCCVMFGYYYSSNKIRRTMIKEISPKIRQTFAVPIMYVLKCFKFDAPRSRMKDQTIRINDRKNPLRVEDLPNCDFALSANTVINFSY